jgi:hypothetical protein
LYHRVTQPSPEKPLKSHASIERVVAISSSFFFYERKTAGAVREAVPQKERVQEKRGASITHVDHTHTSAHAPRQHPQTLPAHCRGTTPHAILRRGSSTTDLQEAGPAREQTRRRNETWRGDNCELTRFRAHTHAQPHTPESDKGLSKRHRVRPDGLRDGSPNTRGGRSASA